MQLATCCIDGLRFSRYSDVRLRDHSCARSSLLCLRFGESSTITRALFINSICKPFYSYVARRPKLEFLLRDSPTGGERIRKADIWQRRRRRSYTIHGLARSQFFSAAFFSFRSFESPRPMLSILIRTFVLSWTSRETG